MPYAEVTGEQTITKTTARSLSSAPRSSRLALSFARRDSQTILSASTQQPPLRVIRAFPVGAGAALVHLHNVSGGLLGGDSLELSIRVETNAHAQVTTTGATRLYRPRRSAATATQVNEIHVEAGGLLEYVPDALIPYAGARFCQRTTIHLDPGAGIFWWEILNPGRAASGEEFGYESVEWHSEVNAAGRLIVAEHTRLQPNRRSLTAPGRMGAHRYLATFFICRHGLDAAAWVAMEEKLREVAGSLSSEDGALWSVSTLVAHGLVVRCVALRGFGLLPGLRILWSAAKRMLYGYEAIFPRKVN